MKWSFFLKQKNEIQAQEMPFMKELFGTGFKVKFVRMDNAGEDVILQKMIIANLKIMAFLALS